ncbi:MAG: hypothetical protein K2Q01_10800, partial [Rickettsiales bacterium]|nr:hypothetical protein [Rickettsiales bacterium]
MSKRNTISSTHRSFGNSRVSLSPVPANDSFISGTGIAPRRKANRVLRGYALTDMMAFFVGFVLAWNVTQAISSLFFGVSLLDPAQEYDTFRVVSFMA